MKTLGILAACLIFAAPVVHADSAGAYIGYGAWRHDPLGSVRYQGGDINVDDDLGLSAKTDAFAWVTIEHPVPLLPNFRFQYNKVSLTGQGSGNFTFGGSAFSGDVSTDGRMDQYDATMYYQVLDNWVNFDLGVNIKRIDGNLTLTGSGARESKNFTATLPMLYANALFNLPFTGLSAGVEGSHIQYDNNTVSDYRAKLPYQWNGGLGLEGGWRHQQFKLDNADDVNADVKVKGPFLDLFYHF